MPVKKRPSKTPAKGAKGKVSKDSDKVQSSKAEQPSIYVMQGESEQPSSSFLEVPRGDKVKSGSTSRRTSFNSEASGNESDVSEVNDIDVEESWNSMLEKKIDIEEFIEGKKEKGESWWIELLGTKVGFDAVAKKWIREEKAKDNSGLLSHKSTLNELVVRLACEVDISPGTAFEAKRIFALFESLSDVMEEKQRRKIVELIVQKDKTNLLKLICDKESRNKKNKKKDGSVVESSQNIADRQYFWKGELSGFATIAELLNYAIDQGSRGSARLLVERIYSTLHPIYNQGQYLDSMSYLNSYSHSANGKSIKSAQEKKEFFKELLEKVIEKGFTDSLLGMLGGDIAQLILKMSKDEFEACDELQDIYNMTKSAVIRVLQSLVQLKDEKEAEKRKALIKELIEKGVTVVKEKNITEKDLIALADEHKIKLPGKGAGKDFIKQVLQKNKVDVSKIKRKLSQDVVYSIIVELFFYQHEQIYAIAEGIVENKLIFYDYYKDPLDKDKVKEVLSDLTQDIEGEVLKVITQLNKPGRAQKNLFSRLVFKKIMLVEPDKGKDSEIKMENVKKIIKACVALRKEPMQKLVQDIKINEINSGIHSILTLIDVKLPDSIAVLDTPSFNDGDATCEGFQEEIDSVHNNPSSAPAFSGFSRRIIDMLKAGDKGLPEAINEVEKNMKALDDEDSVDVEDTFQALEMLHPKIGKEQRRKIVELIVQKDKTNLLKLICDKESRNKKNKKKDGSVVESSQNIADRQYFWKGELSGFATIAELLNYAIDQGSRGSARLLVERIYSTLHPIYNQGQYLDSMSYLNHYSHSANGKSIKSAQEKEEFFKELLEKVIEKGFTDSLLGMLGGDIAQLILKMSKDEFEACDELQDIYNMTKSAVIRVLQSLVQLKDEKEAEKRKALIKELIEKGVTVVKEKNITEKDLIALADEHKIKLPGKGAGKDFIKQVLQKNKVDVSKIKRKLSQDVVYSIIVELFFYQHEQIYAIAEGTNKLIFCDTRKDLLKKGKVKEVLSDLTQDIEGEVLKVIKQLNRAVRAQKNFFSRLVFKEIMLVESNKGKDSEIKVENVEKIIKACVAICQEPMQKLVDELRKKGVTISKEVMNVLKLVGVDPLELEKSMTGVPENSNVVLNRNIPLLQVEDLTLSSNSGSEKSTSDELRQPSADAELTSDDCSSTSRDPLKINIAGPERVAKAKVLSSVSPGSKAVEKKNKGFMQSNCGQGENSSYNKSKNSHRHGGKVGSISRSLDMIGGINLKAIDKKKKDASIRLRARGLLGKVGRQMNACPPSVQQLLDANRMMYMEKSLEEVILNYNTLSYNSLYESNLLDRSLNESSSEEAQELYDLFESSSNFIKYENAVDKLVNGNVVAAKRMLLDLVNDAVEPACYAYVLVFFKEIMRQCDVLNNTTTNLNVEVMEKSKDEIDTIIQLLKRATLMEPAGSFLLGMMKRYNIGECSKFMDGSWEDDLIHVVNVARDYHFFNIEQYILKGIDHDRKWNFERCGLGIQKKHEYLKEMGKYSLYEITLSVLSRQHFDADVLNDLFQILSEDKFPEALYSYGAALLQVKVGKTFKENIKEAMEYLNLAASVGHEGAKFLLGTLPFNNKVSCTLTSDEVKCCICKLEDYINNSDGSCLINEENIDKAAHCLAVEYYAKRSHLVRPDKQKAEKILDSRKLHKQLHDLQSQELSLTLDDSSTISPSFSSKQSFSPLLSSSKVRGGSSSGFSSDCSTIEKVPIPTELGSISAENQSGLGR